MVEQKASYFKDHSLEEAYLSHLPGGRMDAWKVDLSESGIS